MRPSRAPLLVAFAAVTACNGATPQTTQPTVPGVGTQIAADGEAGDESDAPFDVSPVAAPGEVVVHLRVKNPHGTLSTLASYANVPGGRANTLIAQGLKGLLRDGLDAKVDVDAFAELVVTDAPLDVVVIADMSQEGQVPEPMLAFSLGLSSVPAALSASKGHKKLANGVWEIGTQERWGDPCVVAAAAGKAPARLICGERKKHLEKVAAFVARNVPTRPDSAHDLRVEVSLRGILDKYGRQWANQAKGLPVLMGEAKIGIPKFDQALMEAADAVAEEAGALIRDADAFVLEVGVDETKGADVAVQLRFADSQSWTVQALTDGQGAGGPAPEIVWKVPAESEHVFWGRSGDPARFQPALAIGRALLEGAMEKEKLGTAADRQAIASLLRVVQQGKHVPSVVALGHFPGATTPKNITDIVGDAMGWYLMGFDEKPAEVKKWLEDAVKVYNRPTLQKVLKDELGSSDAKHLPIVKTTAAPAGLGGGALAVEVTIRDLEDPLDDGGNPAGPDPTGKPKTVDLKGYLLLIGDGERTWLGVATDKAKLLKLMVGVKTGANTLANRTDLGRMQTEAHAAGGVTSVAGMVAMIRPAVFALMAAPSGQAASLGQEIMKIIEQMPHKGRTPIFSFTDVDAGAKPRIDWSVNVPKGSLEDLGHLFREGASLAMQP